MREVLFMLVGAIIGGALSWAVTRHYYRRAEADTAARHDAMMARQDEIMAHHVVAAMLPRHPVKDSKELLSRVDAYLTALKRARADGDGRGLPVYREDGTIAVDWSMAVGDAMFLISGAVATLRKEDKGRSD